MSETFSGADGRTVIAADTADEIGEVKQFVLDRGARRIDGVHVAGRGKKAEVVPWSSVRSFGTDAVIVEAVDAAHRVADDHEIDAVKGNISARGSRVLTTHGFEHGRVDDVEFDPATGELTAVETSEGRVEASAIRSLGSYALVVDAP